MTVEQYNAALLDEKFNNDRARIKQHETHMKEQDAEIKDLRELTVEIAALTKQHETRLGQQEERLSSIEKKPSKIMDAITSAAISAIVAFIMGILLK